ncbi:hypothetical protein AHAS_Ahas13G0188200 [Arachis hypogaea]
MSASSRVLSPSLRQRHNRSLSLPSSSTAGALFPVIVFVFNRGSPVSISASSKILFPFAVLFSDSNNSKATITAIM